MPDPVKPAPKKKTLFDTLTAILGVKPEVRYEVPPYGAAALGEYEEQGYPKTNTNPDGTLYINPDSTGTPSAPLVMPHELGHALYSRSLPDSYYDSRNPGPEGRDPELQALISDMWDHPRPNEGNPEKDYNRVVNKDGTEAFAQAFGVAVDDLRASPRQMFAKIPSKYQQPDPNDVRRLKAWLLKKDEFAGKQGIPFSKQEADNTRVVRARRKP